MSEGNQNKSKHWKGGSFVGVGRHQCGAITIYMHVVVIDDMSFNAMLQESIPNVRPHAVSIRCTSFPSLLNVRIVDCDPEELGLDYLDITQKLIQPGTCSVRSCLSVWK